MATTRANFTLDKIYDRVYNNQNYTPKGNNCIISQGNEGEEYNGVELAESRRSVKAGNTHRWKVAPELPGGSLRVHIYTRGCVHPAGPIVIGEVKY